MPDKKNILYVGPYRQNDGWGQAAKDYILALKTTQHNVHCQPIYMSNNIDSKIDKTLEHIENNHLDKYDIVIQHVLPMMMSKTSLYNIGLLFIENQNFSSESVYNLNLMDEIWVSSSIEKQSLIDGGIKKPIRIVSHPTHIEHYDVGSANIFNDYVKNHYKFYFVGEYIQRKNIHDILVSFFLEFDISEPVSLVLKLSAPGLNTQQANQIINNDIVNIQKKLRNKKQFNKYVVITDRLSAHNMSVLHKSCDCFVVSSYGEAFCRPAAEALMHGNYLISSSNIGVLDYVESTDVSVVESFPYPVLLDNPGSMGILDIYNAAEVWYKPNILDMRSKMRLAFENQKRNTNETLYRERFSHKNIGDIICTQLV